MQFAVQYVQPDGETRYVTGFPCVVSAQRFAATVQAVGATEVYISKSRQWVQ